MKRYCLVIECCSIRRITCFSSTAEPDARLVGVVGVGLMASNGRAAILPLTIVDVEKIIPLMKEAGIDLNELEAYIAEERIEKRRDIPLL